MVEVLSPTCERFFSFRYPALQIYDSPDCTEDYSETDVHVLSVQRKVMKSERLRLESYRGWPSRCSQRPETLAKAGLFYTGVGDRVKCPFCLGVLKEWQHGDDPMREHRHHFSYCKFVLGENVGNIPITEEHMVKYDHIETRETVDITDFTKEETRLLSFSKWPRELTQTPEALAHAGLYHFPSQEKPDRVKCAYCQGKLFGWKRGDDPWLEHARCFPECRYMKLCIGQRIIDDLLAQLEKKDASRNNGENETVDDITILMKTNSAKSALDMGFSSHLVKRVIEAFNNENIQPTTEELVNRLLETDDEGECRISSNSVETTHSPLQQYATCPMQTESPLVHAGRTANQHVQGLFEQEKATSGLEPTSRKCFEFHGNTANFTGPSQKQCRSAFMSPVQISGHIKFIFTPCGHQACCGPCSVTELNCPTCGTTITGCFKSYVK